MTTTSLARVAGHFSSTCALAFVLAVGARAQPADMIAHPSAELPLVVVTATRLPTPTEQTAAAVTVITRTELDQAQLGDALSALKSVPGLNIADNGMPGQTAGIFMRGTETRHTVILLDGHRLPTGLQRYFDLGFFPLANLDRIEVVRGPLGSTQGGGALGGAINFITRRDAATGLASELSGEYGSFATRSAGLAATVAKGGVSANLSANTLATDNRRPNSEFTSASTFDTFGWEISKNANLDLLAGYLRRNAGVPGRGTPTTAADLDENLTQNLGFVSPGFTLKVGNDWTHSLNFSCARQRNVDDKSSFSDGITTVVTRGLTYQSEYRPSQTVALQAGAESDWQDVKFVPTNSNTTLPFQRRERENAIFVGAQVQPLAGLTLLASVRRDVYTAFYGSATTWRYAASYRVGVTGLVLHGSDGTAFAAPEIQNFVDFGFGGGPAATTLRPERSRGQEIGFTQEVGKLSLGATAFRSQIHDLVDFDAFFAAKNIGLAKLSGVEHFVEWRFNPAGVLRLNYTYLEARDEVRNQPLRRRPRHTVSVEVYDEIARGWTLGGGVRAVADREDGFPQKQAEDYMVARIFTQYAVSNNLRLKLRIENLFDEKYAEVAGFPAVPRGVYGSVEWRF